MVILRVILSYNNCHFSNAIQTLTSRGTPFRVWWEIRLHPNPSKDKIENIASVCASFLPRQFFLIPSKFFDKALVHEFPDSNLYAAQDLRQQFRIIKLISLLRFVGIWLIDCCSEWLNAFAWIIVAVGTVVMYSPLWDSQATQVAHDIWDWRD